jgi:hypothetical protein
MFTDKMQGDIWGMFFRDIIVSFVAGNMVCKCSVLIEGRTEFTCI